MMRRETAAYPARQARALAGLAAYQAAGRTPPATLPTDRAVGRVRLLGPVGAGRPVVFVPSLINPSSILDLAPDTSLLRWLAAQGMEAWLVDWGTPGPDDRTTDLTAHVERLLIPLIAAFAEPPILVGYCLGGTLAMAAALGCRVAGLATIAAPWRFDGYGEARPGIAAMWQVAKPACEAMGVVPMELLQAGFWQIDPARTIAKYESFAALDHGSDAARAFVRLEDWANAGAPLPYAAGAALFEDLVAADLPGSGRWRVNGAAADPAALSCPAVEFVSLTDRIVPSATAAGLPDRRDLSLGHVGMIVGGRARARLWEPLRDWIAVLPRPR